MILYIDGTLRPESRTRELAEHLAGKLGGEREYVRLSQENILPMDFNALSERDRLCANGDFDDPAFKYARQFANADEIIIAAPFWNLSFPSVVKAYLERVCVVGLTFCYSEQGVPVGMCRAKKLYYVTTAGGTIADESFGYGYVRTLATGMFGIGDTVLIKAENLDVFGSDVHKIISEAKGEIDKLFI